MTRPNRLRLYEELMLLALSDRKGTLKTAMVEYGLAGAMLAELLLEGRVAIGDGKKQLVDARDSKTTYDPLLDEALERIAASKRRGSLKAWVRRIGQMKRLRHRVSLQLCREGILRADENTILLIFKQKIYPELDPMPERQIVKRMRAAVASASANVDPRTAVLISLAHGVRLLPKVLGKDRVNRRKQRIAQIMKGEVTGKATRAVVEAAEAAVLVATIVPAIAATASSR